MEKAVTYAMHPINKELHHDIAKAQSMIDWFRLRINEQVIEYLEAHPNQEFDHMSFTQTSEDIKKNSITPIIHFRPKPV